MAKSLFANAPFCRFCGPVARPAKVNGLVVVAGALKSPVPVSLTAATRTVYDVPFVSPSPWTVYAAVRPVVVTVVGEPPDGVYSMT